MNENLAPVPPPAGHEVRWLLIYAVIGSVLLVALVVAGSGAGGAGGRAAAVLVAVAAMAFGMWVKGFRER